MTRLVPFFAFLLFVLPQVVSCDGTEASTEDNTEVADSDTDGNDEQPATPSVEPPTGDNFEIIVLEDTLMSPRKEMSGQIGNAELSVNYGSPAVKGRTIFGDLVPYGKVWRTGANEATQITFGTDVLVGTDQQPVPAGTYALFTLPDGKEDWTFIINNGADLWGAYDYQEEEDVARVSGTAEVVENVAERMDFSLSENEVRLHWADLVVSFPVAAAESGK